MPSSRLPSLCYRRYFSSKLTTVDVAVVGGGFSGVYLAYQLQKRYPAKKVEIFEKSNRYPNMLLFIIKQFVIFILF
jgi:cation diffusion facilitator CzcD-associated flavoprotein CzcO